MKSPNIMSTTGRMPVIAAPTPSPVMPASEIGESITRAGPNSSTSPESTLNGVPASATSSPMMYTLGSRRISSAKASRMAWPKVISRVCWPFPGPKLSWLDVVLSIDILIYLTWVREWRVERELNSCCDLGPYSLLDLFEDLRIGEALIDQPGAEQHERIPLSPPVLLLFFGAVVRALDVAYMVTLKRYVLQIMKAGPSPRRASSTKRCAAAYTARTSCPSTSSV